MFFALLGGTADLTGTQKTTTILLELKRSNPMFCALLGHRSLSCRLCLQRCFQLVISSLLDLVSRDVSNWLFRLFWRLPKCSVLSLCTTVSLVDSSPEMLPPGYFVSSGSCFQRCPNWLFRLFWRISKCILCSPRAPQSPL